MVKISSLCNPTSDYGSTLDIMSTTVFSAQLWHACSLFWTKTLNFKTILLLRKCVQLGFLIFAFVGVWTKPAGNDNKTDNKSPIQIQSEEQSAVEMCV